MAVGTNSPNCEKQEQGHAKILGKHSLSQTASVRVLVMPEMLLDAHVCQMCPY